MASKNPPPDPAVKSGSVNEGEGNKTADRHYREATKKFVDSERGKQEIENAGDVSAREEHEIEQAEEIAKSRARELDPQEDRRNRKSHH